MIIKPSNIRHASIDELYSARAEAWSCYFKQKPDRRVYQTLTSYNATLTKVKGELGIYALEEELYSRGYSKKPRQPFKRCDSFFRHV